MRQRTIKTQDAQCETAKLEPMAEGVIPLKKNGQRDWSSLSDAKLVERAQTFMRERGAFGRKEFLKDDVGFYQALERRKLLDNIGFEQKKKKPRDWSSLSDEQFVLHVQTFMKVNGITGKKELEKADHGIYSVLRKRKLLDRIGFQQKSRIWRFLSDDEVVEFAKSFMKEKGISGSRELETADRGIYTCLRKRGLIDNVGFQQKRKKGRDWSSLSDEQVIQHAKSVMEEKRIKRRSELGKADSGIYCILKRRALLGKIEFMEKPKQRDWSSISDDSLVLLAQALMKEKSMTGSIDLVKANYGLYKVLQRRGLLEKIGFKAKMRKPRAWQSMSDDQLIDYSRTFMKKSKISGRKELQISDRGLYAVLQRRSLVDRVFADIEQTKKQSLERDLLSGLRQAPEAMERFGEGK